MADTNVLISALLGKTLRHFLIYLKKGQFELVFSKKTFHELSIILERPKFKKHITESDIVEFLELLQYSSHFIEPTQKVDACRDVKDNIFLECAIELHVDYIVSGDTDLLILNPFHGIEIISPFDFLKNLT